MVGLLEEERAMVTRLREGLAARVKEMEKCMAEERQAHLSSTQQLNSHNAELQQEVKVKRGSTGLPHMSWQDVFISYVSFT